MEIDQAPDGLGRGRERPAGPDGGQAELIRADPEHRAAVHRLYRALVDHVYGLAHDAWERALPDLRSSWEKQQHKYPERTRAPADTRLTPEQDADVTRACAEIRDEGRHFIAPALDRIEAADPTRRLAGREHMLKGEDRIKEKVADYLRTPGVSVATALERVPDTVRFTFIYNPTDYARGTSAGIDRLSSEGFGLVKLKNSWTSLQYKGINGQWRDPGTGLRFEVQFHTLESLAAKELTHEAYERIRSSKSSHERQECESFQRQANAFLITPAGTDYIRDFPENR